jgi:hypothetical protein
MTRRLPMPRRRMSLGACGFAFAALVALAGCTAYAPTRLPPGSDEQAVLHEMGRPTGRYALPGGGSRLEFARGPFGKHTYMVDLDAAGRMTGWRQVLTEADFGRVLPGEPADEVLRDIGHPSQRSPGGRPGGEVWSYRYETVFCQWFQVSVSDTGRVTGTGYAPDPMCDVNLRDRDDG